MANPANYPLLMVVGDTKTVNLTIQDGSGVPINITGRTYAAQVRATVDSTSTLCSFTCSITSASAGTVNCSISASITGALNVGDAIWSLRETNSAVVSTLLEGPVKIVQSPTR